MVNRGYQIFSVSITSIIIALVILLLIIMFIDAIINRGGIVKESRFFYKLIYHLDIFGKIFNIRPDYKRLGGQFSQDISSEIPIKEGMTGGCGSCNNYSLSSSLTYDPQIFLQKRKQ